MWLNEYDLDITCIRLKPHKLDDKVLLNVEQIIPLPEASEYRVRMREKEKEERSARTQDRDMTRFDLTIGNIEHTNLPKRQLAYLLFAVLLKRALPPLMSYRSGATGWLLTASWTKPILRLRR
jgi:hypothetical protein